MNQMNDVFSRKKNMINVFCLLFCIISLFGCFSAEKSSYNSVINDKGRLHDSKNSSHREIAYLKNISQFEEANFQFITKQMKTVIKNYSKMKNQLIKIETKLDQMLNQLSLTSPSSHKENTAEILESRDSFSEIEKEDNIETDSVPLLEKERTDGTNIFPVEEKEDQHIQNQKGVLEQHSKNKKRDQQQPSLIEAKNLFKNKSYESAISKFQKYRDENPKGIHYPEATFYIGQSFKNLKMPIEAEVFFNEIIQSYPNSLWASRSKDNLKE